MTRALRRRLKHARRHLVYYGVCAVCGCLWFFPRSALLAIFGVLIELFYIMDRRDRLVADGNLRMAFPKWTAARRRRVVERVFRHLARFAVDVFAMYRRPREDAARVVPVAWEDVASSIDRYMRGGVAVTGHLGSWELLGILSSQRWPGRLGVVARRLYFAPFNDWVVRMRESFGTKVLYQDDSPLSYLRHLRAGKVLGILPDQDVREVAGMFIPFFGVDAWTPTGPAALALAAKVPMYVTYLVWDRVRYRIIVEGPLPMPDTGSRDEDIRLLTEAWTRVLERCILAYPDQWVWFHRRWRTRPT